MLSNYGEFVEKIDASLEKRNEEWPARGEYFRLSCNLVDEFTAWLIKTNDFEDFQPDPEILERSRSFVKHPVVICGYMKSGTTLLNQLLDGHPNLLVPSGGTRYLQQFREKDFDFTRLAEYWMRKIIMTTGQRPYWWFGKEEARFRTFLNYLRHLFDHSHHDNFIKALVSIFAVKASASMNIEYWVEKTTRNEKYVSRALDAFPDAKFLNIIRDPLANITSLKKWDEIRKKGYTPIYWAYQLKAMFKTTIQNRARLGPERYQIIRYEDLVSDTEGEGKKLCAFLNLPFHENLLVPTKGGEAAVSNSMFSEARMVGTVVNQSTSKRWKGALTEREKEIVVSTLYNESIALGYSNWKGNEIRKYRNPLYGGYLPIVYLLNGLKRIIPAAAKKWRIHRNRAG